KTLIRAGAVLAFAALFVPSVASAALTASQISAVLAVLQSFGVDAATLAKVDSALHGTGASSATTTPAATPSCTISASASAVQAGQNFTVTWKAQDIETPVMRIDDGTKRYWLASDSGTSEWTAGPSALHYVFTLGYGGTGVAPFSPACSITVQKASAPAQSGAASASVDQTSVTSVNNAFALSGAAVNTTSFFIALVNQYSTERNWNVILANHSYVAYTNPLAVSSYHWTTTLTGVPDGTYTVLFYDRASATPNLLGTATLTVNTTNLFGYGVDSGTPVTLGAGQSASDGGVQIMLMSVGTDASGAASANFQIAGAAYSGAAGAVLGGFADAARAGAKVYVKVQSVSASMNAATFLVSSAQ
ncbi:MAG TPA: hypothetical protein VMT80_02060, partial [Candidatus Paceibacterota bacterium]|nr:hypothetical protein [Candidatus Paceibacterota bacterium]